MRADVDRLARVLLLLAGVLAVPAAVVLTHVGRPAVARRHMVPATLPVKIRPFDPMLVDSLASVAVDKAPFRPSRQPAEPEPAAMDIEPVPEDAAPPRPDRPALRVTGITIGSVPTVLVEGLLHVQGTAVIEEGQTLDGITVRAIRPDTAILTGYDTSWTLHVRNPWD